MTLYYSLLTLHSVTSTIQTQIEVKKVNKELLVYINNRKRKHFNIKTKKNVITLINNKQITNRSLCQI